MLEKKLHPLTYNKGDMLAVTIKPDDHMQWFLKPKRYELFLDHFHQKLMRVFPSKSLFRYWFRIELSEPVGENISGQGSRLHLHGIIVLREDASVFQWLISCMSELLVHAQLSVKHIGSEEALDGWIDYCSAQKHIMPKNFLANITSIKHIILPDDHFA